MVDQRFPLPGRRLDTVGSADALPLYRINRVTPREVWQWLDRGWADTCAACAASYFYGLLFAALGFALTGGLLLAGLPYLIAPLIGGFLLVGPILAIGLLDISRRLERGERPGLWPALTAVRRNPLQILIAGAILAVFMLIWVRVAVLIFVISLPYATQGWGDLVTHTLTTPQGLVVLAAGTVVGAGFALVAFVFGVITLPVMLDQKEDIFRAALISWKAVQINRDVMALWATLIVLFIGAGLVMAYVGLILTLPLIGHATWHAYRALVVVEIPAPDAG